VQLHAVFTAAPVLVAIISFSVFVLSGNELTVSIAFTVSLSLFFCVYFWCEDINEGEIERRLRCSR